VFISYARVESAHHKTELGGVAFRFEVTQKTESSNHTAKSGCATSEPGDRASIEGKARAEGLQA
jgi:hypothetical protein